MRTARSALWLAAVALLVCLVAVPSTGATVLWNLVIPLFPLTLAAAPGFWRATCPMATSLARVFGSPKRGGLLSPRARARLEWGGIVLLLFLLPLRHVLFDLDGRATAGAIVGLLVLGLAVGRRVEWRAAWCGGLCPMFPFESLYGVRPLVRPALVCEPCRGCMASCPDLVAPRLDDRAGPARLFLVGGMPGFIAGWFQVPDRAEWGHLVPAYGYPLAGLALSLGLYLALRRALPVEFRPRLALAFVGLSLVTYYGFRIPALVGMGPFADDGVIVDLRGHLDSGFPAVVRGVLAVVFAFWFLWPMANAAAPWSQAVERRPRVAAAASVLSVRRVLGATSLVASGYILIEVLLVYPRFRDLLLADGQEDAEHMAAYVDRALEGVPADSPPGPAVKARLNAFIDEMGLVNLKVYGADGRVQYAYLPPSTSTGHTWVADVLATGRTLTHVLDPAELTADGQPAGRSIIESYVPRWGPAGVRGVSEVYVDITALQRQLDASVTHSALTVATVWLALVVVVVWLARRLRETQREVHTANLTLEGKVASRTAALAAEFARRRVAEEAVVDTLHQERRRIGQLLHDDLGQRLTGISLMATAVANRAEAERSAVASIARGTAGHCAEALDQVRKVAHGLATLEDIGGALSQALAHLARTLSIPGEVTVTVEVDGASLPARVETQLYRVAQEAATNAVRHGGARNVAIHWWADAGLRQLEIRDDGKGFDPENARRGLGLRGIYDRATYLGASLDVDSRPGGPTTIRLSLRGDADGTGSEPLPGARPSDSSELWKEPTS